MTRRDSTGDHWPDTTTTDDEIGTVPVSDADNLDARLSDIADFANLSDQTRRLLQARFTIERVARGTCLVCQGDSANSLFIVLSGRFTVNATSEAGGSKTEINLRAPTGTMRRIAEIASGELIGEIAFFTGGQRTADVIAIRDSVVARLTRSDFDAVARNDPDVWKSVVAALAGRLAQQTRQATRGYDRTLGLQHAPPRPRTIAIIGAGDAPIPPAFLTALIDTAPRPSKTCFLSAETVIDHLPGCDMAGMTATAALNSLEDRFELVVYVADTSATAWSETAIRHADDVLIVANGLHAERQPGKLERIARDYHDDHAHRLIIIHDRPRKVVSGSARLLANRPVSQHHHVAIGDLNSMARLWRFLCGTAEGLVACGGGSFCSAHIGIYEAAKTLGHPFDMFIGTSGGAAMAGAFAQGASPDDVSAGVHRMFVEGRALGRYALPLYGALDHTHFDQHLRQVYGDVAIEDIWRPYCAVAADLSDTTTALIRTGPLWQAIRASAAIPGLLPPFYTRDGRMLVDGSVIANVPVRAAHALKNGPNMVVSFRALKGQRVIVDYDSLPGRREVFWRSLLPATRRNLPAAPTAANVLVRSLMADRDHFERYLTARDTLLLPPVPENLSALDWRTHRQLRENARVYAAEALSQR